MDDKSTIYGNTSVLLADGKSEMIKNLKIHDTIIDASGHHKTVASIQKIRVEPGDTVYEIPGACAASRGVPKWWGC